ncbi:piggyBac transposable element-derived protein 4-like [Oscarella lobularis]|uniref:piggyBac transposable element-derived protein 4-like n=1 Tax=Oscarella lobularis TaxID=121494 RepID=UPI003313DA2F
MGYMRFPRIQDYWQKAIPILSCHFSDVMTLTRFWQILRFFHVCDPASELPNGHPRYDKLQKVRPLVNLFEAAFKSEYNCKREITIDEAMIPYKGRIGYKQYMKDKPTKWGIKVFILAESSPGYIYKFEIYTGKRRLLLGNTVYLRKSS